MSKRRTLPTLPELIQQQMPRFDEVLIAWEVPLPRRPMRAALLIIEHCLIMPDDKTKPTLADSAFGAFYWPARDWYERQYGKRFDQVRDEERGVALLRGDLIPLVVPVGILQPSPLKDHYEIHFPLEIVADENVLDFLEPKPALAGVRGRNRQAFVDQIKKTVISIRKIWSLSVGLDGNSKAIEGLRTNLHRHLRSVPGRVTSGADLPLALFDLRMCIELCIKLLLQQQQGSFKQTHDFEKLLEPISSSQFDRKLVPKAVWSYRDVNTNRYELTATIKASEFFEVYQETLTCVERLLRALKRDMTMNGAVFTMKKLPWQVAGPEAYRGN